MGRRKGKKESLEDAHFFKPRPGVTIEVRLYDEIWNKFYDERAAVGDKKQMRRVLSDLREKGVDLNLESFK